MRKSSQPAENAGESHNGHLIFGVPKITNTQTIDARRDIVRYAMEIVEVRFSRLPESAPEKI